MFEYRLSVLPPVEPFPADVANTFFWHSKRSMPYFHANVGPQLAEYGPVKIRNIDLVRIAAAVLAADRSASRSGSLSRWNQREISLTIDVLAVKPWDTVKKDLEQLLGFLTGDAWSLTFLRERGAAEQIGRLGIDAQRVVLLSGGADSATGALLSALELVPLSQKHILVSHWSSTNLSPLQTRVANEIERLAPGAKADHVKVNIARGKHAPDGTAYGRENSTRSRSFLFIALGLAIASVDELPLWLPENGYASINPPLSKSRRGSLSTKTTHPKFLAGLRRILKAVGAHYDVHNPYADLTKGEMFSKVADAVGVDEASTYLTLTSSCSHTGARTYGTAPNVACGVCFGCVLRRASFTASGLNDGSQYFLPKDDGQQNWVATKSVVPAMRDFLSESFSVAQLAHLQIPSDIPLARVESLVERGREELRQLAL
ncbi:hypothetical protein [Clavibacter michiganensis]|uniref:hypothetical protein n=1 Tax=Clavibacter michiganensis TaxID=28447 RepID=UPI000B64C986|nr:hypothetical protein [Clavibacter michiganensis]MDO4019098.1 hypothetical protein [Clavibacter michiganensis]MDO4038943.1 hypothetical protein [Clavibacter michiganensis]MDO4050327.1 hypothetical protein [Clavibacter michiganensis]MDO4085238.1 hypothetical protein [Clavibacter michiganensis]MDO4109647.1 hypothetical protein [Clavibacter michiganensis]